MKKKIRELNITDGYNEEKGCNIKTPYPDTCKDCPMFIKGNSLCRVIVAILDSEVELEDDE